MEERHQNEWHKRSELFAATNTVAKVKRSELYDLTWRITAEFIIKKLDIQSDQTVFDAGFGWGRVIHGIKTFLPETRIRGIELTEELYKTACRLMANQGFRDVDLHCADILDLTDFTPDTFDAVYSTRVLHYITDKKKALTNLHRILKPSGSIVIIIPNRFCPYRWFSYNHPLYSIVKLKDLMAQVGFEGLEWGSIGFIPTRFGRFPHTSGLYALEKVFQKTFGINRIGGLAYIAGKKKCL